jgi:hypothetical protein
MCAPVSRLERSATASGRSSYEVTVEVVQGALVVTWENGRTLQRY